ncbi:hypothetical protein [Janthinobacterium sp. LB3P118]|uniref:hypothetical protein n=1 Tax=Janthinobacterium sp. LB3P118 TaxID=3424195 RepID=UPI003F1F267D
MDIKYDIATTPIPQLNNFRVKSLHAQAAARPLIGKISAKLKEAVQLTIEAEDDESIGANPAGRLIRIVATVKFDGRWSGIDDPNDFLLFVAEYGAIFVYNRGVALEVVERCMESDFYRKIISSQAYPLIQDNIKSQLKSMGLNSSRKLGFDFGIGEFSEDDSQNSEKKKIRSKKKI